MREFVKILIKVIIDVGVRRAQSLSLQRKERKQSWGIESRASSCRFQRKIGLKLVLGIQSKSVSIPLSGVERSLSSSQAAPGRGVALVTVTRIPSPLQPGVKACSPVKAAAYTPALFVFWGTANTVNKGSRLWLFHGCQDPGGTERVGARNFPVIYIPVFTVFMAWNQEQTLTSEFGASPCG